MCAWVQPYFLNSTGLQLLIIMQVYSRRYTLIEQKKPLRFLHPHKQYGCRNLLAALLYSDSGPVAGCADRMLVF